MEQNKSLKVKENEFDKKYCEKISEYDRDYFDVYFTKAIANTGAFKHISPNAITSFGLFMNVLFICLIFYSE